ncbi:MAG TPA: YaiI/YqxD family protein [Candidatus Omnitrophota bacterium]|nr:YaiI/YqxD family protein [Candidatus Omnitrophota bacterium]
MIQIYVDADACSVKQEVLKVARRHGIQVTFAANSFMRIPDQGDARLQVVEGRDINAVDDWIESQVAANDIVITADIPLADRCLKKGAQVLDQKGGIFTASNIGNMLAARELMSQLRDAGGQMGGPPPFSPKDRSRFLHTLDQAIQSIKRTLL